MTCVKNRFFRKLYNRVQFWILVQKIGGGYGGCSGSGVGDANYEWLLTDRKPGRTTEF